MYPTHRFRLDRTTRRATGASHLSLTVLCATLCAGGTHDAVALMYTPLLSLMWLILAVDAAPQDDRDSSAFAWSALYTLGAAHVLMLSDVYLSAIARQVVYELTFAIAFVALVERCLHHLLRHPSLERGVRPHD